MGRGEAECIECQRRCIASFDSIEDGSHQHSASLRVLKCGSSLGAQDEVYGNTPVGQDDVFDSQASSSAFRMWRSVGTELTTSDVERLSHTQSSRIWLGINIGIQVIAHAIGKEGRWISASRRDVQAGDDVQPLAATLSG